MSVFNNVSKTFRMINFNKILCIILENRTKKEAVSSLDTASFSIYFFI